MTQENSWKQKTEQETQKEKAKKYAAYVKSVTPTHNLALQMLKAFLVGGSICCLGQVVLEYAKRMGLDAQTAGSW
jgi:stage V sporulation protein AC